MITALAGSDRVTLFWDLPEGGRQRYLVFCCGGLKAVTEACFCELRELQPEQTYRFSVSAADARGQEKSLGTVEVKTEPEKHRIDVTKAPYFAVGDGRTLNTGALQQALDACGPGDAVCFPRGDFLTGALRIHSDTEIRLQAGSILHGTGNPDDYLPKIPSRFEGVERQCYSSLLNIGTLDRRAGITCRNVRICGEGTVCCEGQLLGQRIIQREKEELRKKGLLQEGPSSCLDSPDTVPGRVRPRLIHICCARNVELSGLTLMNGASWNVHMIYCDRVTTWNCRFRSEGIANGDGWDPDSSTNCTIFGCSFATGDDSIAIKSGKNPEGNLIGRPSAHIRIFDCVSHHGHGITIGSEMSGGVEDVQIWNCNLHSSAYGLEIKATRKRGGYVRNVRVRCCRVSHLLIHPVLYNDDGEAAPGVPAFSDLTFEDLTVEPGSLLGYRDVTDCAPLELIGFPEQPAAGIRILRTRLLGCRDRPPVLEHCGEPELELQWQD